VFDHVYICDEHLVVFLELLELLWVVGFTSSFTHDDSVLAVLVDQVEHVGAHPLHLGLVDLQDLVGVVVLGRVAQLEGHLLALLLFFDGGHAEDCVVVQQRQHAVSVIDNVAHLVVGSKCNTLVRSQTNFVPLVNQIIQNLKACSG
jgi:hypothetical protein